MSDPAQTRLVPAPIEAIQRDGTLVRDLRIADWMQRSRPHGEYRGSAEDFRITSTNGRVLPVGPSDWVVRIGGQFYSCPSPLFHALINIGPPTSLCGECQDTFRPADLVPGPDGLELCTDCILEIKLSRNDPDPKVARTTRHSDQVEHQP